MSDTTNVILYLDPLDDIKATYDRLAAINEFIHDNRFRKRGFSLITHDETGGNRAGLVDVLHGSWKDFDAAEFRRHMLSLPWPATPRLAPLVKMTIITETIPDATWGKIEGDPVFYECWDLKYNVLGVPAWYQLTQELWET